MLSLRDVGPTRQATRDIAVAIANGSRIAEQGHRHAVVPLRKLLDEMIEAALPAKRAGDDPGGERSIAFILEMLPAGTERVWQIDSPRGNRPNRVIRRGSRRRGHDCDKASPGATWCPRTKSWTRIARLPSG